MKMIRILFFIMVWLTPIFGIAKERYHHRTCQKQMLKRDYKWCTPKTKQKRLHRFSHFIGDILKDAVELNVNVLFSLDTIKILAGFLPVYLGTRMIDERAQCTFHDRTCHTNKNQMPDMCHKVAKYGVAIPMVGLSSLAIIAKDEDLRMTGRILAIGLPFVHSGKDIIKKLRCKACLRPWHEGFSKEERSSGGFPSGHMANVTYMATLFGMRFGPKFGVPLGLFAAFVFADFINCNRHYISQMVAGAALGVIFAVAANRLINKKLCQKWSLCLGVHANGSPEIKFSYRF